jgi:hypothetical protein
MGCCRSGTATFPPWHQLSTSATVAHSAGLQQPRGNINNAMIAFPYAEAARPPVPPLPTMPRTWRREIRVAQATCCWSPMARPMRLCCGADPVKTTVDAIRAAANPTVAGTPPVYTLVVGFGQSQGMPNDKPSIRWPTPEDSPSQWRSQLSLLSRRRLDCAGKGARADREVCRWRRRRNDRDLRRRLLRQRLPGWPGLCAKCVSHRPLHRQDLPRRQVLPAHVLQQRHQQGRLRRFLQGPVPADLSLRAWPVRRRSMQRSVSARPKMRAHPRLQQGKCVTEPLCENTICHQTQGCFGGTTDGECRDDACRYVTCPTGTVCHPFTGSCESPDPQPVQSLGSVALAARLARARRQVGCPGCRLGSCSLCSCLPAVARLRARS